MRGVVRSLLSLRIFLLAFHLTLRRLRLRRFLPPWPFFLYLDAARLSSFLGQTVERLA